MYRAQKIFNFFEGNFFIFFLLSLFIHLIGLDRGNYLSVSEMFTKVEKSKQQIIKLRLVPEREKKIQIVETKESEDIENLKKARDRFLSKKNNFFKKEMIAKRIGKFTNSNSKGTAGANLKKKSQTVNKKENQITLSDLGSELSRRIRESKVDYVTTKENHISDRNVQSSSATTDYINDVPLGELTQLNTTEFKFYGFYHRIRQKLEQHWGNSLREKARKLYLSGRRMPGSAERITALVVVLDSQGNIVRVKLKSTSGVKELDNAAIESFNKAGPFPNPPKEMLLDGNAHIEWGFVVKT